MYGRVQSTRSHALSAMETCHLDRQRSLGRRVDEVTRAERDGNLLHQCLAQQ